MNLIVIILLFLIKQKLEDETKKLQKITEIENINNISFKLKIVDNKDKDKENLIYNFNTTNTKEFRHIDEDDEAFGSVLEAIIPLKEDDNNKINHILVNNNENDIFNLIFKHKYNVLIDAGALFKNYSVENIMKKFGN